MTFVDTHASTDGVPMLQVAFADKEKKRRSSSPTRYCAAPLTVCKQIYEAIIAGNFSSMRPTIITGIVSETDDVTDLPDDAGQDLKGQSLNFNIWRGADAMPTLQKLYIPSVTVQDPANWHALGETVAGFLAADGNITKAQFVPVNY